MRYPPAMRRLLVAFVLLLVAGSASAQGRSEPRLALVIGNGAYREAPLRGLFYYAGHGL